MIEAAARASEAGRGGRAPRLTTMRLGRAARSLSGCSRRRATRSLHASAAASSAAAAPKHDTYTHGHHASVVGMHATRTAEVEAAYLVPHLAAGQRVLDVGCGPGTITVGFAELVGSTGHVTAIDTVDAVLEQAQELLAGLKNVTVAEASVYELPYASATTYMHLIARMDGLLLQITPKTESQRCMRALVQADATFEVVHAHQVLQHVSACFAAFQNGCTRLSCPPRSSVG